MEVQQKPLVRISEPMLASKLLDWPCLVKGDMIQFDVPEGPWKKHHWAIFVGDGKIIHLTGPMGMGKSEGKIEKKCSNGERITIYEHSLVEYAVKRSVRVNNWADEGYSRKKYFWQRSQKVETTVFEPDEVVRRAREFLKEPNSIPNYHLLNYNCEYFATYCRYNEAFSGQSIGFGWGWGGFW